jgi:uncharacterized membrane protein
MYVFRATLLLLMSAGVLWVSTRLCPSMLILNMKWRISRTILTTFLRKTPGGMPPVLNATESTKWVKIGLMTNIDHFCLIVFVTEMHWTLWWGPQNNKYYWFQTFAVFCMLYVFFWVIPRRLNFQTPGNHPEENIQQILRLPFSKCDAV